MAILQSLPMLGTCKQLGGEAHGLGNKITLWELKWNFNITDESRDERNHHKTVSLTPRWNRAY